MEVAAAISGTWNAATIKQLLGENMGVIKLPKATIGGQQVQLSGYMGFKLIGVNGFSKNKGEAHKLAQWLTNEQNQQKRFEVRGFGPTNKVVAASTAVLNDPVISVVMEQAQFNRAQKGVPGNYWTPMGALITPFIAEKEAGTLLDVTDATLQEYLDALVAQITGATQA
jgi:arabinogalactan oligomer/maltooligosaccharide transport system substrate-binding protein